MIKYRTANENYFPLVEYSELTDSVFETRDSVYTIVNDSLIFIGRKQGKFAVYTVMVNNSYESVSKHYNFDNLHKELPVLSSNINKEYMNRVVANIVFKYQIGGNSWLQTIENNLLFNLDSEDYYHIINLSYGLNLYDNSREAREEHFIPLLEKLVDKAYSKILKKQEKKNCCFWNRAYNDAKEYLTDHESQ